MMKLVFVSFLVAIVAADVSDLFKGNNRYYQPYNKQPFSSQYRRPVTPRPVVPVYKPSVPVYKPSVPVYKPIVPVTPRPSAYQPGPVGAILRLDSNINPDGSYIYAYETEDGTAAQQQGQQKQLGENSGNVAQGSFRYTSPEGVPVSVQYIADENGFQPQSDVLPVAPPIPSYILRSLEYNAAHPEPQTIQPVRRF